MNPPPPNDDVQLLRAAAQQPLGGRLRTYLKLSGPGWLQSAITLGGGSLSGSLYLGVLGGFGLLWLQPVAMIMGIIMLSAIGYVVMTTGRRPLQAIHEHVNPVLAYGWAAASLVASMVWAMPQYSLAIGVLQQNLLPDLLGSTGAFGEFGGKLVPTLAVLVFSTYITWNYGKGGRGVQLYELILKIMVGVIVLCFAGVIARLTFSSQGLDWGKALAGLIPNFGLLFRPADAFLPLIEATHPAHHAYWTGFIIDNQRDVIVAAAATAVGINMTFLFPYSILRRGWGREFVGLCRFDLATGMFIPFVLATSFVVMAAASQFHAVPQPGLLDASGNPAFTSAASPRQIKEYESLLARLPASADATTTGATSATAADRQLAAMLVTRDASHLAAALEPLTGAFFGRIIFGFGVLGMTLSTITLLMLISGQVICELLGREQTGWTFKLGSLLAVSGALGPFLWSKAAFWLAVPTSVFAFILMPIAYLTFFLMMNQRKLLGDAMPRGGSRWTWNLLMGTCLLVVAGASGFMLWAKGGVWGLTAAAVFLGSAAIVDIRRRLARAG
ncbi:MAG TPA: divalent metal cation transporter [Opitutaceae bacterium]|nr:divalent metal cation transporter [Opitutaceae bacterium]